MILSSDNAIKICLENLLVFKKIIKHMKYEKKGIFNSEMLLFTSLCKYFNVKLIIESGRANGQSTKIIAESFNSDKYKIYSVELSKYNRDAKIAYQRLKGYRNLNLIFGNSFQIIPKLIDEDCCILIDGPKSGSIEFAISLLQNPLVKAVCVHDISKDSKFRKKTELIFNNRFFTDDLNYVNKLKFLDRQCWIDLHKIKKYRSWGPYRRGDKIMKSYSSTLLAIINSEKPFDLNYMDPTKITITPVRKLNISFKNIMNGWPERISKIIKFPFYYIFYEKKYRRKNEIDLKDLLKKWIIVIVSTFTFLFFKYGYQ